MYENVFEIDVLRCFKALIKKWKFTLILTVLFFVIGFGLTLGKEEDRYSATATAYAAADTSYTDATNAVTAMNAYLDVAKSYKVCQRAALIMGRSDVEATDVQESVYVGTSSKAKTATNTVANFMNSSATIISFTATTNDPELSMEMADAMAQSYTREMTDILHSDSVKTLDTAYTSYKSYDAVKEAWKRRIVMMLIGGVLSCIIIVGCEMFDTKVRTVREASLREELPVIGVIPDYKG